MCCNGDTRNSLATIDCVALQHCLLHHLKCSSFDLVCRLQLNLRNCLNIQLLDAQSVRATLCIQLRACVTIHLDRMHLSYSILWRLHSVWLNEVVCICVIHEAQRSILCQCYAQSLQAYPTQWDVLGVARFLLLHQSLLGVLVTQSALCQIHQKRGSGYHSTVCFAQHQHLAVMRR